MKLKKPNTITVYTGEAVYTLNGKEKATYNDICIETEIVGDTLKLYATSEDTPLKFIKLRFNYGSERRNEYVKVLGDDHERAYGKLSWTGIKPSSFMPWYTLVSNGTDQNLDCSGRFTEGFGVKVQPNSMVTWNYDIGGVTMWADVRNGTRGIRFHGRKLLVCEIVFGEYRNMSAFEAGQLFCRKMSPNPVLPKQPVYGSNNWYYAYGESCYENIISDCDLVEELTNGIENRPYMVVDEGWSPNYVDAPWDSCRPRFRDMKQLCDEMKKRNVIPGIWVCYLANGENGLSECKPEWQLERNKGCLDPSNPEVIEYVKKTTERFKEWGYKLIKHDYSTYNLFGLWGNEMREIIAVGDWGFYDKSKTTAEIILDFYRAIRESAGDDCVVIGCNTISHLSAGIFELNRTGNDTSGNDWETTRQNGVNSLAFRLIQNGSFYMADADCVGILGKFPWELNKKWLDVLAKSGSPLFVSCLPEQAKTNKQIADDLKVAYAINSVQKNECRPLDWMETEIPAKWLIDGNEVDFDWYEDCNED